MRLALTFLECWRLRHGEARNCHAQTLGAKGSMGAQGAQYSNVSESVSGGRGTRESALMTDAQEHAKLVEPEHPQLTGEKKGESRAHANGPVWNPLDPKRARTRYCLLTEVDQPKVAMEPSLIFSLTIPDNVYPLPNVAEMRLCRGNLGFGGAQRSLLSASSYERVRLSLPPLMQPSFGAKRMVGASGASLTVIGELRRCPVSVPCKFGRSCA